MKPFDTNTLINSAVQKAGLSDFGAGPLVEDFELFIGAVNAAAAIRDDRRGRAQEYIINLLVNRLRMIQDLKDNPEILKTELLPPVVILSPPRTGTTKLQRLLGSTGNFQNLLYWHTHMFARLPGEPEAGVEKRIAATREFESWAAETVPDYHLGHPMYTMEPEEDVQLINSTFRGSFLTAMFIAPDYVEFLANSDMAPSFDYMKLVLKYLQWQFYAEEPKGWFLKSPGHFGLEAQYERIFPGGIKFICSLRNLYLLWL